MSLDVYLEELQPVGVFSANITHNLTRMADVAGIYEALWRPGDIGITMAKDLVPLLEEGLNRLIAQPERFKALNPTNGWGSYEGLCRFVEKYIAACREHPEAIVKADR